MITWLASYPRSGNTFLRVLLNSAFDIKTYSIYNDVNTIAADANTANIVGHEMLPEDTDIELLRNSDKVYFIKTHDKSNVVDDNDKVIYLIRDGRESSLSYMNFINNYSGNTTTLNDVISGDVQFGSWGDHVADWAAIKEEKKLLMKFEQLTSDPESQIVELSRFIDIGKNSDELPDFKKLHEINPKFFRKGKTESWKNTYSQSQMLYFDSKNYNQLLANDYEVCCTFGSGSEGEDDVALLIQYFEEKLKNLRDRQKRRGEYNKETSIENERLKHEVADNKRRLMQADKLILEQDQDLKTLAEKDAQVTVKTNQLIEKDSQLSEKYALLIEQYEKIEEMDSRLVAKNLELAKKRKEIEREQRDKRVTEQKLLMLKQDIRAVIECKLLKHPLAKVRLYKKLGQDLEGNKYT